MNCPMCGQEVKSDSFVQCKRCGGTWKPRVDGVPVQCPRCKSPFWNRERVRESRLVQPEVPSVKPKKPVHAKIFENSARVAPARIEHDPRCRCGVCVASRGGK